MDLYSSYVRDVPSLLGAAGFVIEKLETMYLPGWRPGTLNYWGAAKAQ